MRRLYLFIFKIFGFKFEGSIPPELKSFIVIVAPHTAGVDFPVGIMARRVLKIDHVKYLGKSQLFKPPFGFIFRWLGGTPVERTKDNNLVETIANKFKENENFAIGLAPEGTRKKVSKIKTGFYHIAKKANVPIIMIGFDFGNKTIKVKTPFYPGDNIKHDFKEIISFFASCKAIKPERGITLGVYDNMEQGL